MRSGWAGHGWCIRAFGPHAQNGNSVGTWEWNLETGNTYWSNGVYELLGLASGEGSAHINDFVRFIHPDDRQRVLSDVESAIKKGNDHYGEFRIIRDDGAIVWLSSKGCLVRGASP
jgi:PAS domain S-box-containing protein